MSSSKDGMFWICAVDAVLQLRLIVLQKDAPFLNKLLIVKQAKLTVCIFAAGNFLYSFSAFKYLPAPRVPVDFLHCL